MLPHVCLHWDGALEALLFTPNLPTATCAYAVVLAAHLRRMTCGDNLFGFYRKTDKMHQRIKFIYFGMTLHMFRTVFSSIISSSRLYIQQQAYVKQILLSAC